MSMKAICPNCNVENEPTATNCEVCKTALGALLVGDRGGGAKFFGLSAMLSLGLYMLCWFLELSPIMLIASVFYGTLLTSYFAKHNVVWASALGGVTAIVIVIILKLAASFAEHKGMFVGLAGHSIKGGEAVATGKVIVGVLVMLLAVFPFSLIGASVGEHLSVRRRAKPA